MSHYLLHHILRDTRFNRECSKHIAPRRLAGSPILCPELIILLHYRIDNLTREIGMEEKDSKLTIVPTSTVSAQLTQLVEDTHIETIRKKIYFSGKAHLRFLDVEVSGGFKVVEAKFSAPHLEALLSIHGNVDTVTNKMEVDYRRL